MNQTRRVPQPFQYRSDAANQELSHWLDRDVVLTIRRRSLLGGLGTILFHAALLYLLVNALKHTQKPEREGAETRPISLLSNTQEKRTHTADSAPLARIENPLKSLSLPNTYPKLQDIPIIVEDTKPSPAPVKNTSSAISPNMDMQAYINAQREKRRAEQYGPTERQPSAEDIRNDNIRRNLQAPGTNGVFQIISKGLTTAQFSFRGWISGASNPRLEIIDVDAGPDGDIERAMVRKMIAIIRRHYTGDFNWESQRLGRVLVLSARVQDNAGLEEFLLREFFSDGRGNRR